MNGAAAPAPRIRPRTVRVLTDAERLRYTASQRRARVDRLAEANRDLDFLMFCEDAGISPSPQSCLAPERWAGWQSPAVGCGPRGLHLPQDADCNPRRRFHPIY
jgi:hypothetical protein